RRGLRRRRHRRAREHARCACRSPDRRPHACCGHRHPSGGRDAVDLSGRGCRAHHAPGRPVWEGLGMTERTLVRELRAPARPIQYAGIGGLWILLALLAAMAALPAFVDRYTLLLM